MNKYLFVIFKLFLSFLLGASICFIFALALGRRDYKTYYIYDDSTFLVVISRCFFGQEFDKFYKLQDYILIDGVYFVRDKNNYFTEVSMSDILDFKSSETGSKGDIYE